MARISGFMNVYRSGWFHREGKPACTNRHAGDLYLTRECAEADISPRSHYIDTVPIEWDDPELVQHNPDDSMPIPLSQSRRAFAEALQPLKVAA